jgi:hypothetical protein
MWPFGGRKTVFVDADILVIGGGMAGCGATYESRYWGRDLKIVCVEKANIERSGAVAQGLYAINCYMGMQWGENQPEDHVRYARNDLMGLVREDLGYDIARHVDATVHKFEEWGLPMMRDPKTGRYQREGKWQIMIHGESYKPIVAEATRKAAESRSHKLDQRLTKGEKRHRKRMATVATVYTVAPHLRTAEDVVRSMAPHDERDPPQRPRPENKRVWASLEKTPEEVIEEAFREATSRDPDREKTWVALVDGNKKQLAILKALARTDTVRLTIVVDIMHVAEYIWDASLAFHGEASKEREEWVSERLLSVLHGRASWVAAGMRRGATLRRRKGKKRKLVDKCADYLLKYKAYLRYDRYLAKGLPIATGVIEGACRHLVCDRMDGGARWSLAGAEAVLRLRALRSSGDFDEYWTYHEKQEYQRNHVASYADGKVAPMMGPRPPLRRVK